MKSPETHRLLLPAGLILLLSPVWYLIANLLWFFDTLHLDGLTEPEAEAAIAAHGSIWLGIQRTSLILAVVGIGLLAVATVLRRKLKKEHAGPIPKSKHGALGWFAVFLGLCLNLAVISTSLHFFRVEPGTHIRPMGWAGLMFLIEFVGLVLCLPVSIASLRTEQTRWRAIAGIVLSVSPWFLSIAILRSAAATIGFELSP